MPANVIPLRMDGGEADAGADSALAGLMRLMEAAGPLKISFEDLVGMTQDHPELALPDAMRLHTGPLCRWAKRHVTRGHGLHACAANKYLANRQVLRQHGPVTGLCHMGLTDICQPLIYREQVMGVFYYGSVLLQADRALARGSLLAACRAQDLDEKQALRTFDEVPVITREQLREYESRLQQLVHVVELMMDGLGLPADCYKPFNRARDARTAFGGTPRLVVRAVRAVAALHDQQLTLPILAKRLDCRPAYLGRIFRRAMGISLSEYLERTRVERACKLLRLGRLDITHVAYEVGYTDKSNFSRSFRKVMGVTPGTYRRQFAADQST